MLRVNDLRIGYGDEPVLDGLDVELSAGEFASLVGPSGSGKSTLLRAIAGLHEPDAGEIESDLAPREIGFLFQDDALLPWRTVAQNAALGLTIRGVGKREARERSQRWLDRLGVGELAGRWPRQLSGGQRKRVAIAQVLALEPALLLMDEPFASLDAIVRHRVVSDLLRWVEEAGIAVLLVTHDLEEAIALGDRVHLLPAGPRASIAGSYDVALPRPRDPLAAKADPRFAELLPRLWADLERVSAPTAEAAEAGTQAAAPAASTEGGQAGEGSDDGELAEVARR
ncbi:ABC transporter ATP-binding protein [Egibacter rhizosphaerae]|uniref:ABC transporter ATP-binding protein n=1 Tax=Egibacter rhizosphaerae TaxID=1670831 RepID=A0A411YBV5_9ACTN|nr:ABC transporter ATP-binding protein [Egibacter rhizosphaerae]QBI18676.1 ABC transporter ATP-binding protein [Egibacter rhizosphaerae]